MPKKSPCVLNKNQLLLVKVNVGWWKEQHLLNLFQPCYCSASKFSALSSLIWRDVPHTWCARTTAMSVCEHNVERVWFSQADAAMMVALPMQNSRSLNVHPFTPA